MSTTPVFAEAPTPSSPARREVAFVDTSVNDWQTLVEGIQPGIEVVLLDGSGDGLAQMAEWAATHSGYDAIHVLSHGTAGQVRLGTATLDAAALTARAAELTQLGAALNADGDLLFYGCNVAAGQVGVEFVQRLAQVSVADVTASDDRTGSTKFNGDWRLEVASGEIEATPLESSSFSGILAQVEFSGDTGTVTDATVGEAGPKSPITMTIGSDTLSIVSTDNTMYLDTADNLGDGPTGMSVKYIKTDGNNWTTSITLSVDGGKVFDFVSMSLQESNGDADTFQFIPNENAAKAVTSSYSSTQQKLIDLSSNPDFDNLTSLTITTNDAQFQVNLDNIILENIRLPGPTVTGVAITSATGGQNSTLNAGDVVFATVTMSANTTVDTTGGTPTLGLNIGGTVVQAAYVSGTGTTSLVFQYTIQSGQTDANGISIDANGIALNGGTLKDASANNVTLTFSAVTDNGSYQVDTTAPATPSVPNLAISSDTGSSGTDDLTNYSTPTFTGTAEAGATVKLYSGATEIGSGIATGGNWAITSSILSPGAHSITAQATDAAGNVSGASTGLPITIDTTAPTLNPAGSNPADDATNIAVNTSPALLFSENIAFGTGLVTLYNVTNSSVVETFDVATEQGTSNGQVSITGNTLTINPTNALAGGKQYAVQIAGGAIRDTAGNNLSAISDNTSYNFTTAPPPGITLSKISANVTEGGTTDTYTVVLNAAPTADVTIHLDNTNGQVAVASSSLTFTTANWATPQTVTLTAANDTVGEGKHSGVIRHAVSSTDSGYNNIAVSNVQVAISDNDLPASDPTFISQSANFGLPDVGFNASPTFVDIDSDGDLDAFIGNSASIGLTFFRNTGTASSAAFTQETASGNPFGLNGSYGVHPAFADIDGDGDLDAFIGRSGGVNFYRNIGAATAPSFTSTTNPLGPITAVSPVFGDIDNDGDLDAFIGQPYSGMVQFYRNTTTAGVTSPSFASQTLPGLTHPITHKSPAP